jgi:V-type H+-transporting ATPase subunit d
VLIDTPVGPYFIRFLEDSMEGMGENRSLQDIQQVFKEMKPEFIRTSLRKMWLEDFYEFCRSSLNPTSVEWMVDLLKFEADCKTVQVVYNSIGKKENNNTAIQIVTTRKQLCPSLGYLYPDVQRQLLGAMEIETLR